MLGYARTLNPADIRERRTYRKVYRELELAVCGSADHGFTDSENYVDHACPREIVSPLLQLDGRPGAVLAADDLDGRLGEQRVLARTTAGYACELDCSDGEGPPTAAPGDSMIR